MKIWSVPTKVTSGYESRSFVVGVCHEIRTIPEIKNNGNQGDGTETVGMEL